MNFEDLETKYELTIKGSMGTFTINLRKLDKISFSQFPWIETILIEAKKMIDTELND